VTGGTAWTVPDLESIVGDRENQKTVTPTVIRTVGTKRFHIYAANGWGTEYLSPQASIIIGCDTTSTEISIGDFPTGMSVTQQLPVSSKYTMPALISSNENCGVRNMTVVDTPSLAANASTILNPEDLEFVVPVEPELEIDYKFSLIITADGGFRWVSPQFDLTIGCTPSMVYTDNEEFSLKTTLFADEIIIGIYTILPPSSNREFCPLIRHEVVDILKNDQAAPEEVFMSSSCFSDSICDKLDIKRQTLAGTVTFKIKSRFGARDDVFTVSPISTIKINVKPVCPVI